MPVKNLVGWSVTGLIFMLVSRTLWGSKAETRSMSSLPLAVYVANMLFAMIVSADVGLWIPIVLAAVLGIVPAAWIMRDRVARPLPRRPAWSVDG
jgi:putative membrane protein